MVTAICVTTAWPIKKTAIEQLSRRMPFIDIDKIGIWGHSGGGFMSTARCCLSRFFKVAVSESGNHENNIYIANGAKSTTASKN